MILEPARTAARHQDVSMLVLNRRSETLSNVAVVVFEESGGRRQCVVWSRAELVLALAKLAGSEEKPEHAALWHTHQSGILTAGAGIPVLVCEVPDPPGSPYQSALEILTIEDGPTA